MDKRYSNTHTRIPDESFVIYLFRVIDSRNISRFIHLVLAADLVTTIYKYVEDEKT